MKISILCNDKSTKDFEKYHGFSAFVSTSAGNFIYDTGFGDVAVYNAEKLGINLKETKGIIISHGHYDHTGGLETILKETGPIDVYVGINAFAKKVKGNRNIGFPLSKEEYKNLGANIITVKESMGINPEVRLFTCAPLETGEEPGKEFQKESEGETKRDLFEEELTLGLTGERGTFVITGCSHRGIGNILSMIDEHNFSIKGIIGGFHLNSDNTYGINKALEIFKKFNVMYIGPCHCTDASVISQLKQTLKERIFEVKAGDEFII